MSKATHNSEINFLALFLLAVFLNLFFVQLACSLPHVTLNLTPAVSEQPHHGLLTHGSHAKQDHHSAGHHHNKKSATTDDCCTSKGYTPFLKATDKAGQHSVVVAPHAFPLPERYTLRARFNRTHKSINRQALANNLRPKIPDIRVFLHSFLI